MNVLLTPLMHLLVNESKTSMNCIKRGTGMMELSYGQIVFRDFMNYSRLIYKISSFFGF